MRLLKLSYYFQDDSQRRVKEIKIVVDLIDIGSSQMVSVNKIWKAPMPIKEIPAQVNYIFISPN